MLTLLMMMIDGSFSMSCNSHSECKCEIQMSKGQSTAKHTRTHTYTLVSVCVVVLMLANCRHLCPLGHYVNVFAYFLLLPPLLHCHYCPCLCKIKSLNSIAWCRGACVSVCVCVSQNCPERSLQIFKKTFVHKNVTCVFVGSHKAFVVSDMPASRM